MFGHKWEPVLGTIAGVQRAPGQHRDRYLVDVIMADGIGRQEALTPPRAMSPDLPPCTEVNLEVNSRTGRVRFGADPVVSDPPGQTAAPPEDDESDATAPARPAREDETVSRPGPVAIQDVAEIVRRLGGGAAGGAVAAALAGLGLDGDPGQPGTSGTAESHVTEGDSEARVISGAEAAELMRELLGLKPPGSDRPGREAPGRDRPDREPPGRDRPHSEPSDRDQPGNDPPGGDPPGNDPPGEGS